MKVHLAFPHQDWQIETEQVPRIGEHVFWNTGGDIDAQWLVSDVTWTINPDSPEITAMVSLEPASHDAEQSVAARGNK